MDRDLRYLLDRVEISETVLTYSHGLDLKDWELYGSVFASEIELDFSDLFGEPPATVSAAEFVEFSRQKVGGFAATQHVSPNHIIEIGGDTALCKAYLHAWHWAPSDPGVANSVLLRGYYDFSLKRVDGKWKICGIHMIVWAKEGNMGAYDAAAKRLPT